MVITQFEPHFDSDDAEAVKAAVESQYLNESKLTREFEGKFAEYVGTKYAVATTSGTAALFLALKALRVGLESHVIVPDYTMIGTANAVRLTGASVVLNDVGRRGNIRDLVSSSGRVSAVVPVHVNGRACDMPHLLETCAKNSWPIVEDAAQTLGSRVGGRHLGSFGDIGCFSLATTKIITSGQGGMVVTNDEELMRRVVALKDQGTTKLIERVKPEEYLYEGYNFKFTEMQAALALSQWRKLPARIERKRQIWTLYQEELANISSVEFIRTEPDELIWYVDILLLPSGRNTKLQEHLARFGIQSRLFYPPIHTHPRYFADLAFPNATELSARGIWLPTSSTLTDGQVVQVCNAIREYIA